MYALGTWFVSGICVWIPCIKETMMMIIIRIIISSSSSSSGGGGGGCGASCGGGGGGGSSSSSDAARIQEHTFVHFEAQLYLAQKHFA
jgi:hypothetical protein